MNPGIHLFFTVLLLSGLILMAICVPLIRGTVKRNGLYGFRTPKTLSSDEIWYPANRYAGRALFVASAVITAGTLVLWLLAPRLPENTIFYTGLGLTLVPIGIAVALSFRYLARL